MDISIAVSLISLICAFYAVVISKRSLSYTTENDFYKLKTELLMKVSDRGKILDNIRIEIGTQKAIFENEPQSVKILLQVYTSLFAGYLPNIEIKIKELDLMWNDISTWSTKKSFPELFHAQATLYKYIQDDETVYESGMYCVNEFKEKLRMARQEILVTAQ